MGFIVNSESTTKIITFFHFARLIFLLIFLQKKPCSHNQLTHSSLSPPLATFPQCFGATFATFRHYFSFISATFRHYFSATFATFRHFSRGSFCKTKRFHCRLRRGGGIALLFRKQHRWLLMPFGVAPGASTGLRGR